VRGYFRGSRGKEEERGISGRLRGKPSGDFFPHGREQPALKERIQGERFQTALRGNEAIEVHLLRERVRGYAGSSLQKKDFERQQVLFSVFPFRA
jgi:hypothetical protein